MLFRCSLWVLLGVSLSRPALAQPVSNAFTYQGELRDGGVVADGIYDLRFRLYDALAGGAQVGPLVCVDNVAVADGKFSVELDFGGVFGGTSRYMEIDVRADTGLTCASGTGFIVLSPRQKITSTPYASYALAAGSAQNAVTLNGQLPSYYTNATNLTGTLADARLSTNVSLLSGAQAFSGVKTFNASPVFASAGAPFAVSSTTKVTGLNADLFDGLDSGAFAAAAHNHDAGAIVSGVLADARIPSSVPRVGSANTFTGTNVFSAFTGVNRGTPITPNEVFGLQNAAGGTGYGGMYISSTDSSGGRPFYGYSVNGNSAWTYVEPGGQWRVENGGDRLAISRSTGNVGIGTTTPGSRLEVSAADAAVRVRNTNDPGGGFVQNTFSTLQLGLYNPTASTWGAVPAAGQRSMFGVQNTGRVGTMTNTSGSPVWRNTIDDGAGNASFQGNIAANNLPGIKFSSTSASGSFNNGSVTLIENITVNVPATGFLRITARSMIGLNAYDFNLTTATLELKETTGAEVVIKDTEVGIGDGQPSASGMNWRGDITLEHAFAVGAGTRSFKLRLLHNSSNGSNLVSYSGAEITIMYFPQGL